MTNVRLYNSGAIKIRYADEWMAHYQFKRITDFIKNVKSDRRFWGERTFQMAQKIKFTIVAPPRFSKHRRLLADAGMRLKNSGQIKYYIHRL